MQQHIKIGEGGRLIIPASYRKALNLNTGDEVIISLEDGVLRIFRQLNALKKIRSLVKKKSKGKGKSQTDDFIAWRKKDSE